MAEFASSATEMDMDPALGEDKPEGFQPENYTGGRSGGVSAGGGVLHVAAVATHLERYMPLLVQSAGRLGVKLDVLGYGEKLSGFAFRLQKTLDYVDTLPPGDIVLFIDAFDVVLLQNAEVIMKKFLQSGSQLIISKDADHPNYLIDFFIKRVFRPVNGTFINIGAYIGRAGYIRDLMKSLARMGEGFSSKENDQELLARYLAENKHLVGREILIDEHCDLFLTIYGGDAFWIGKNEYKLSEHRKEIEVEKDGSIRWLPTDSYPCVVHFPCNGNADELLAAMGLKMPESVDKNYSGLSHSRYLARMFRHYLGFIYKVFIQLILVVVAIVLVGYMFFVWRRAATNAASTNTINNQIRFVPYQPVTQQIATELPRAFLIHNSVVSGNPMNTVVGSS